MILPGDTEFPNNAISLIALRIKQVVDPDLAVVKRPLRTNDPSQTVGVFPSLKAPNETTIETSGPVPTGPTISRYNVIVQTVVKDTVEENAISVHSILSNRLFRMLYRDNPLHLGLTALAVVADNSQERMQRRGVQLQRYLSNEIQGSFIQTSWIEFWFETETVGI